MKARSFFIFWLFLFFAMLPVSVNAEHPISLPQISFEATQIQNSDFKVMAPQGNFLTGKSSVWVQLRCLAKTDLKINSEKIACPGVNKIVTITLPIELGINHLVVEGRKSAQTLKVFRSYPLNFSGHDERKKDLQILLARFAPAKNYDLKQKVTRAELAYIFDRISFYKNPEQQYYALKDVSDKTLNAKSIKRVVEAGWLGIDDQNQFFPNKELSRVEMLAAILRYSDIRLINSAAPVPFKDVPNQYWGYPVVSTALANNLISGSTKFEPEQKITRMELLTTLLRLPEMKEVLDPWK